MRIKRIICLLLSIILVIGTMPVSQANQQNCIFEEIISDGIGSSEIYLREQLETLHNNGGVSYGFEWYIISMLRSGKDIDSDIVEKYYTSVCDTARNWDSNTKPTDVARVALALTIMGKSVTDVNGINLLDIIFNNEKLDDGSNELAYALISVYSSGEDISDKFKWDINSVINELLKFQATDGGFGLYDNTTSDIDMTAICLQALSLFKGTELVDNAISKAVGFLGNVTSEPRNYSDNPNTTAQILIAVSMLNIDVSDFSNGFGIDEQNNIITALEKYRNPEGSGYIYGSDVNSMTTTQVMQAYDAHRKAHKEGVAYWDFGTEGQKYDDNSTDDEPEKPEENEATPADVFVTISDSGKIVSGKDGSYIAQTRITVTDLNKDGSLSVDEALFATHEAYFEGGAKEGYTSHITAYGLSLARLWGKGSIESPSVSGYYLNNTGCFSLADEVKDGDCLTAFNYFDTTGWSDSYAYFIENSVESPKGESVTLTLNTLGYDSSWNVVASHYSGAKVSFLGSDETLGTTDENGTVILNTTDMDAGTYYITAYSETNSIVPAVCKISITSSADEPEKLEKNEATPADVFVTISDSGKIVSGKDGSYIAQARITVTDLNKDGSLSVDEALFATHEAYFEGGAKEGYASHITAYGLSLARLWGKGSIESPSVSGYYLNNTGCFSLADEVKDGDCLTAFNYFDTTGWSDSYAYFIENSVESPKGESVTLTLNALGYDSSWNVVASLYSGAKVSFLGSDETLGTTDENGTVTLNTTDMDAGTYYITAYSETNSIVPAVCKISITSSADEPGGNTGGSTGGGSHNKITVYIRVADPKGSTYLKKTAYSVKKGTTAYELLQETNLNIVASQSTYGFYVNKIENLAEFDEGPESGWIYLVNKKSPSQSSDVYSLNNGDYVEWLYTRNMGKDIDDSNYSGTSISGGSATKDKTKEPETIPETKDDTKFTADTFNDVNEDDWFFNSVKYVYENSLMSGKGSGFEPQTKMTRAMLVTVLWGIEKEPDSGYITAFDDVSPGKWYAKAVCWAENENIVSGIGNNLFGTDDEITREQMVTILYRYVQKKNIQLNASQNTTINNFEDRESISEYANSAMEWAVNCGLIQGKSETTIAPKDSATRAEVATVLMRFCEGF